MAATAASRKLPAHDGGGCGNSAPRSFGTSRLASMAFCIRYSEPVTLPPTEGAGSGCLALDDAAAAAILEFMLLISLTELATVMAC